MAADSVAKASLYLKDMDEVKKIFNRFDTNGDGMISAGELLNVMKALGSDDTSPVEIDRMMAEIDTDQDGFINLQEFADFLAKGPPAGDGGAQELRDAFELYDQDRNGLISVTELHQILSRLGEKCSVQDCARMIQSVDSDGDGYVNFEEFKKMMSNNTSGTSL